MTTRRLSEMTQDELAALSCAVLAAMMRASAVEVLGEAKVAAVLAASAPACPAPSAAVLADSRREAMAAANAERAGYWPSCAGAAPARRRRRRGVA